MGQCCGTGQRAACDVCRLEDFTDAMSKAGGMEEKAGIPTQL